MSTCCPEMLSNSLLQNKIMESQRPPEVASKKKEGFITTTTSGTSVRSQLTKAPWRLSHLFVAEIKGSEQQEARSCVCLAIARPQPPPKKKKLELVPIATCWPCPATGWPFCRFLFAAGPPSVPTLAPQCRLERLHARSCQIAPGRKRWDRSTEHSSGRRRDVHKCHRGLLSLWFKSGQHCSPPKACGSQAVVRPPEQETQGLKPWAADVPVSSRRVPRRHGRITQQPEDVPHGGFGPDLQCYPPRSHGSSRYEVDDRETRCFRAPRGWECLTVSSEALRGVVLLRSRSFPVHDCIASLASHCGTVYWT